MSVDTKHYYVVCDNKILGGEPVIKGTRTPVRAIIELWRMGLSPEEIRTKLPHITLAQIFSALSYYEDHSEEINNYIKKNTIPETLIDPLVKDLV
ncbi:DUF433 domain-containing protein [candidate division WOR-3 bacterium]|nr:DUF433 domain-containing protein [candidate division WOR-3 bacterium]